MTYNELKDLCEQRKMNMNELSDGLNMSRNGFAFAVKNGTLQMNKIPILCELVRITPNEFFGVENGVVNNGQMQVGNRNLMRVERESLELLREQLKQKDEQLKQKDEQIKSLLNLINK